MRQRLLLGVVAVAAFTAGSLLVVVLEVPASPAAPPPASRPASPTAVEDAPPAPEPTTPASPERPARPAPPAPAPTPGPTPHRPALDDEAAERVVDLRLQRFQRRMRQLDARAASLAPRPAP